MKKYEVYDFPEVSSNVLIYKFNSFGPRGIIEMIVEFEETENLRIYNLAFGNLREDGSIDDRIINNNNDREKILATVGTIVIQFIACHPEAYIYFGGSTISRTRLYRMALSLNYIELSTTLNIWGVNEQKMIEPFDPTHNYISFLIKRK